MQESWILVDGKYQKTFVPVRVWKPKTKAERAKELKKKKQSRKQAAHQKIRETINKSKPLTKERQRSELSPSEKRIADFLIQNNILFYREHYFKGCHNHNSNHLLYFDFWIPAYKLVIEFDGLHHFKATYGEDKLARTKENDRMKNRYCRKHKIHMLRISCFDSDIIEEMICKKFDQIAPV